MKNILISICIPSYNGEKTISKTIDSLISNIKNSDNLKNKIEIVITDDCSTDETISIVNKYACYDYVKIFLNNQNLGMDGNFRQVALNANGKYIWYSGQDDIFLEGSIEYAVKAIEDNGEIDIVNVNFSQYSEDKKKYVCKSMFNIQSFYPEKINYEENLLFNGSSDYFAFFDDVPSFLPAIIMKRDFWISTNSDEYIGTYFIQYATILLNLNKAKILAIQRPLIRGLIPLDGWQTNGNKLFSIQLGIVKAREKVFLDSRNPFPKNIFYKKKLFYLRRFIRISVASKHYNFSPTEDNKLDLRNIYGNGLYYLYFLPILFLVKIIPKTFVDSLFYFKKKLNNYLCRNI